MPASPATETYAQLLPTLRVLEDERRSALLRSQKSALKATLLGFPLVFAASTLLLGIPTRLGESLPNLALSLVGAVILGGLTYSWQWRPFYALFKESFLSQLVSAFDPNLAYSTESTVDKDLFNRCQLFDRRPDRFRSQDEIRGKIGETAIRLAEIHAETQYKDSKGNTEWRTLFRGLFYEMDFNKDFEGKTFVLPDTDEATLGPLLAQWFQGLDGRRGELVKLENPEFERRFVVYGSDQIEARYILSPSLMQRIMDYSEQTGRAMRLCFRDGKVYVAVTCMDSFLEPDTSRSLLDPAVVETYLADIRLAVSIVEDLNLNRRIWTPSKRS